MQTLLNEWRSAWSARALVWVLTRREVAARHAGTAVGVLWPYLQPLLTVAAYYLVFDVVFAMRLGEGAPTHAVGTFLVVGALPWMAFCDALARGMNSLIEAGSVLQKNPLPPVLFPVRAVLASTWVFGPLVLGVALVYIWGHGVGWPALALLGLWLGQAVLTLLLAYSCAILAAAVRDVAKVVTFFLAVGVYVSPILFPTSMFPAGWGWVLWLNPMAALVVGYQSILLQGQWPDMQVWAVLLAWLLLALGLLAVLTARSRDQLVDWL